jgi:hypothetical protein
MKASANRPIFVKTAKKKENSTTFDTNAIVTPLSHIKNIGSVTDRHNFNALTFSPILYGQIKVSKIKYVPASTKMSNLDAGKCGYCTWTTSFPDQKLWIFHPYVGYLSKSHLSLRF